jgi:hypothetical protein
VNELRVTFLRRLDSAIRGTDLAKVETNGICPIRAKFPLQRPAMDNSPPDDSRLDEAEAKMRRALGLGGHATPSVQRPHSASQPADHFHRRGKFVRDGEVQVEIVHRSQHQPNDEGNPLNAARQSVRALAAEKERTERLLSDAQATIKDLQTKLGHERLAKDEVVAGVEANRKTVEQALQTVRSELTAEKTAHERSEQALRDSRSAITDLTEQLHLAKQSLATVRAELAVEPQRPEETVRKPLPSPPINAPAGGDQAVPAARRPRGGPRKAPIAVTVETAATARQDSAGIAKKRASAARQPKAKPVKWWLAKQ